MKRKIANNYLFFVSSSISLFYDIEKENKLLLDDEDSTLLLNMEEN